jgi:hypothetical protein
VQKITIRALSEAEFGLGMKGKNMQFVYPVPDFS